jgi:murein DD-endopeptidase MepM/ murein hydrolase activator NlpD
MARGLFASLSRLRARIGAGIAAAAAVLVFSAAPALADDVFPGPITADPGAVVPFYRTAVGSLAAGHVSPVAVAQADMHRPAEGKLYAPLTTLTPTSGFGYRVSPLNGQPGEFHWGQDFAAPCGTPVYAADSGVVRAAGWHPWGGGNRVEIDHGDGLVTTYNHMLGAAVKTGESVEVGQVIGLVGETGSAIGCHLHFETIKDGKYVDPESFSFIPISQQGPLGPVQITDYTPKDGKSTNERQDWAIPVLTSEPAPGESIAPAPTAPTPPPLKDPTPAGPPAAPPSTVAVPPRAAGSAPSTASPTPSPVPSRTPTPTSGPTATTAPTTPPATPSPTPPVTPSPTPSATATPTPSAATPTSAPAMTATAVPTCTSTATPTPTPSPSPTATAPAPC